MKTWKIKNNEDKLLEQYWNEHKGVIFVEVAVGLSKSKAGWPEGTKIRRIDAIRFKVVDNMPDGIYHLSSYEELSSLLENNKDIGLIEIKNDLNRFVIGQVIVGVDMFKREYDHFKINPIVICSTSDPGMRWACDNRGIQIYHY